MRRHNTRVYRAIRGLLGSEADVEDAMQQTYLLAYARLDEFAGAAAISLPGSRASPSTRRSGACAAADRGGSAGRDGRRGGAPRDEGSPEDLAAAREAMRLVHRALDLLSPSHRVVFLLRDVEECRRRIRRRSSGSPRTS